MKAILNVLVGALVPLMMLSDASGETLATLPGALDTQNRIAIVDAGGGGNVGRVFIESPTVQARSNTIMTQIDPKNPKLEMGLLGEMDRGVSAGMVIANHVDDIISGMEAYNPSKFLGCMRPAIVGICIKWTWRGPELYNFNKYRLPFQKVELVDQGLKSSYIPDIATSAIAMSTQAIDAAAGSFAPIQVSQALGAANWMASVQNPNLQSPLPQFDRGAAGQAADQAIDDLTEAFKDDARLRNANRNQGSAGARFAEYHVLPAYTGPVNAMYLALVRTFLFGVGGAFSYVHHDVPVGYFMSDAPNGILPARIGSVSYLPFFFPKEMTALYGLPGVGLMGFPLACARKDMKDPGKTPVDLFEGGLLGLMGNARAGRAFDSFSTRGCLSSNQGAWVPLTHAINAPYRGAVAANAMLRGLQFAKRSPIKIGGSVYNPRLLKSDALKGNGTASIDLVQWAWNKKTRENDGAECKPLERFPHEYGLGNIESISPEYMAGRDSKQHVGVHWKYIRGCEDGSPLVVWDGFGTTQIKR